MTIDDPADADAAAPAPTMRPDPGERSDDEMEAEHLRVMRIRTRLLKLQTTEIYRRLNQDVAIELHNKGYDVSFADDTLAGYAQPALAKDPSRSASGSGDRSTRVDGRRMRLFVWHEVLAIAMLTGIGSCLLMGMVLFAMRN